MGQYPLTHCTEEEAQRKPAMPKVTKQSGAKVGFKFRSAWLQGWDLDPCAQSGPLGPCLLSLPTLLETPITVPHPCATPEPLLMAWVGPR